MSFNLTVERAQNEMLLLNVIRAKDRLPMYLSGISGLTGNVQTTVSSGIGNTYTDTRQKASQSVTARQTERVEVTQTGTKTVTFVLRSPEALIYYLGELARLENREKAPLTPYVCIQGQYQPLFVALPEGTCNDTLVDPDTGRARYSIPPTKLANATDQCKDGSLDLRPPDCEGGRSMQALRLLNQIISLQKSAKDNPSTALVRVID